MIFIFSSITDIILFIIIDKNRKSLCFLIELITTYVERDFISFPVQQSADIFIREIKEELDTKIEVIQLLDTVEYDYPKFHLSMDCFICNVKSGDLILKEHEAAKWLTKETLYSEDWLPADQALIGKIENYLEEHA